MIQRGIIQGRNDELVDVKHAGRVLKEAVGGYNGGAFGGEAAVESGFLALLESRVRDEVERTRNR